MSNNLTYKQKAFINEFVKTKNATAAAASVYRVKSRSVARQMGSENLAKPYIRQSIDALLHASGS
jgi:phage terminase small subunit